MDGTTRQVERGGASKTAANRNLQEALRALRGPTDEPLRPEHRFERAAKMWLVKVDAWVPMASLPTPQLTATANASTPSCCQPSAKCSSGSAQSAGSIRSSRASPSEACRRRRDAVREPWSRAS